MTDWRPINLGAICLLLNVALSGCQDTSSSPHARREPGLPLSSPEDQGLDSQALENLAAKIRNGPYRGTRALLILRNGQLVFERYFDGWHADRLHEIQSISKGIVSLATGIALDRGEIQNLDTPFLEYFPELEARYDDPRKQAITLVDVLRMRTGSSYSEGFRGSAHSKLNRMSRGWTEFWLDQEMASEPGAGWHYDSGGVIALSSVFQKVTGMHVDDYVQRRLFQPLRIEDYEWERNAEGHPHAGGGLHLRPRDLAKIGLLILAGGQRAGRQIVPKDWIDRSTQLTARFSEKNHPIVGYAYLWWVFAPPSNSKSGQQIGAGTGLGGQYLFWIPEYDMLVVALGWSDDPEESRYPIDYLYSDILPAVREEPIDAR